MAHRRCSTTARLVGSTDQELQLGRPAASGGRVFAVDAAAPGAAPVADELPTPGLVLLLPVLGAMTLPVRTCLVSGSQHLVVPPDAPGEEEEGEV